MGFPSCLPLFLFYGVIVILVFCSVSYFYGLCRGFYFRFSWIGRVNRAAVAVFLCYILMYLWCWQLVVESCSGPLSTVDGHGV